MRDVVNEEDLRMIIVLYQLWYRVNNVNCR